MGISPIRDKDVKNEKESKISEQLLQHDCSTEFDHFFFFYFSL